MEPLREIHGFKKRDEDQLNGKVLDLSAKSVFSIIVALFRRTLTFLGDRKGGGASRSSMFQWYSTVESKMSTGSIYIYICCTLHCINWCFKRRWLQSCYICTTRDRLLQRWKRGLLFQKTLTVYFQTEATEVFFSVTKLFHATDGNLRRLLYLIIKEICPSSDEVAWCSIVWRCPTHHFTSRL